MVDRPTFLMEYVFYMFASIFLLWLSSYLSKRLYDALSDLTTKRHLLERSKNNIIEMGFQLYNLTRIVDNGAPGYVYVVKSDTGHYKIGRTNNPDDRRKTFNVKLPVEIQFLVLIKTGNMNYLESTLHRMFSHKRVNGEWFKLSDTDLVWLSNYPGNLLAVDTEPVVQATA